MVANTKRPHVVVIQCQEQEIVRFRQYCMTDPQRVVDVLRTETTLENSSKPLSLRRAKDVMCALVAVGEMAREAGIFPNHEQRREWRDWRLSLKRRPNAGVRGKQAWDSSDRISIYRYIYPTNTVHYNGRYDSIEKV